MINYELEVFVRFFLGRLLPDSCLSFSEFYVDNFICIALTYPKHPLVETYRLKDRNNFECKQHALIVLELVGPRQINLKIKLHSILNSKLKTHGF